MAVAIGAGATVTEAILWEVAPKCGAAVVPRRIQPVFRMAVLEVRRAGRAEPRPVVAIAPMKMARPLMPGRLPAPCRRMMTEVAGPRLRPQVPFGVGVMMDHLGAIAHDDAEAEG